MFVTSKLRKRVRLTPATTVELGVETSSLDPNLRRVFTVAANSTSFRWREKTRDYINPGPPFRGGRSFHCVKSANPFWDKIGNVDITSTTGFRYRGGFAPATMGPTALSPVELSLTMTSGDYQENLFGDPYTYGAGAWNKFKPKTSTAEAAVFALEIGDIPRQLMTTAGLFKDIFVSTYGPKVALQHIMPKKVADHWLNTQFGWVPFINDMRKFHNTYTNQDRLLRQLKRDNGRWIRRSGTYLNIDSLDITQEWNTHQVKPNLVTQYYRNQVPAAGHSIALRRVLDKVWFSGMFKYWVPDYNHKGNGDYIDTMNKLRLYGVRFSPSVMWEHMPWSWLVDWGTNVGDLMSNLESARQDRLVAKYAFVMRHKVLQNILTTTVNFRNGDWHGQWEQTIDSKARQEAHPFGFSPGEQELSPRQVSILIALGLTHIV